MRIIQRISTTVGMPIDKKCACGKVFTTIPWKVTFIYKDEYKNYLEGFAWECECHEPLYVPCTTLGKKEAA